jgi:Domain of unknown function (DUF4336)
MVEGRSRAAIDTPRSKEQDWVWPFWPVVPIYPYSHRRTLRQEVVKDTIWTFEQLQGIFYVIVPIRMTVIKLDAGGLLVYAPVAPTRECICLVNELVAAHGAVKYIILPTISGLEHKAFVGPFARCFPQAHVFVAPQQWSFPVQLPLSWLGFPAQRTHVLPEDSSQTPFADEFEYAILGPIDLRLGKFAEVVMLHKRSQTLLVTDTIVAVPEDPHAIVQLDPYPLLFHARDTATDAIVDTPANRRKGWQRICLFALYFQPSVLNVPKWGDVFRHASIAPERSKQAYFGLFPFEWLPNWQRSFEAACGKGRLFVAPVLQTLILNRAPQETLTWADRVASWSFRQMIPCHFEAPIQATPQQFRQAFSFLEQQSERGSGLLATETYPLPQADFQLLQKLDHSLSRSGLVPPARDRV